MAKELIYTVKSGESLSAIARDVIGDMERWKELAFINGLSYPYIIRPGQILKIPDDDREPMVIEIQGSPEPTKAAPTKSAGFSLTPTTAIVLAVVAAFLLFDKK